MIRGAFMGGVAVLLALATSGMAGPSGQPRLAAPVRLLDGSQPINASNGDAAPAVLDFNRDGKKDLLVGQFDEGKVRIYLNQGTDKAPRFQGFQYVSVGGKEITVPYG